MSSVPRALAAFFVILALTALSGQPAHASGGTGLFDTATNREGAIAKATFESVALLAQGKNLDSSAVTTPFEYSTRVACQTAQIGSATADLNSCFKASQGCLGNTAAQGVGLLYEIYRRPVGGTVWEFIATTCFPDQVPGASPVVTMPMILKAFHLTPWAQPQITTQPQGDITLVGLDTYYKVNWTPTGYQPDEVEPLDPATMLGYHVDIRVKLDHFTYLFGDGTTFGPTPYEGGIYPTGTITHQYLHSGAYPARVETTFGADFRINGGAWAPVPDTVTVPGPPTTVTAKTAHAQLVAH